VVIVARTPEDAGGAALRYLPWAARDDALWECVLVADPSIPCDAAGARRVDAPSDLPSGAAHDLGWRAARGEAVLFLDAAATPDGRWLPAHARAFEDPDVDVVSAACWSSEATMGAGRFDPGSAPPEARPGAHTGGPFAAIELGLSRSCADKGRCLLDAFALTGPSFAVRRSALSVAGGLDPFADRWAPLELGLRLWSQGARFARCGEGAALHPCRGPECARWITHDELVPLLVRHPHTLLLLGHLWASSHAGASLPGWLPRELRALCDLRDADAAAALDAYVALAGERLPIELDTPASALAAALRDDDLLPAAEVERCLAHVGRGHLLAARRGGDVHLDRVVVTDWLRATTPCLDAIYERDLGVGRTVAAAGPRTLRCEGRYSVRLDAAPFRAGDASVQLALPIEHGDQTEVRWRAASSEQLLAKLQRSRGVALGLRPRPEEIDGDQVRLWYEFELRIRDPYGGTAAGAGEGARFLEVAIPASHLASAERAVRAALAERPRTAAETAAALHAWVQRSVVFATLPRGWPFHRILDTGFGTCVPQVRLLVQLCRLASVPARERSGAVFDQVESQQPKRVRTRGYSPLIHTWAEFLDHHGRWTPMEIAGYGQRLLGPRTVPDEGRRREVARRLFDARPFGELHPFRVVADNRASRLPSVGADHDDGALASRAASTAEHELTCRFTPADR
jgi:hypothetical protein